LKFFIGQNEKTPHVQKGNSSTFSSGHRSKQIDIDECQDRLVGPNVESSWLCWRSNQIVQVKDQVELSRPKSKVEGRAEMAWPEGRVKLAWAKGW